MKNTIIKNERNRIKKDEMIREEQYEEISEDESVYNKDYKNKGKGFFNASEAYHPDFSNVKTEDNCYLETNPSISLYNGSGAPGDRAKNRVTGIRGFNQTKDNWKEQASIVSEY